MLILQNVIAFWKTTLPVNLGVSIWPLLLIGPDLFLICFSTLGFALSISVKESKKQEYLFYLNNGLPKWRLILSTFLLNFIAGLISVCIIVLIKNQFG